MRWFRIAADQGNARAAYNIGVLYERGWGVAQDYAEAMRWYRKAADHGDVRAQFNIGGLYHNGWGVARDETEATRWYRKAADQGDAPGQLNVGTAYANGWGVARDDTEAMRWYRMAANQGNPGAQFNIGVFYHEGWGVAQDEGEAREWITKAATNGSEEARNWLATHPIAAGATPSAPAPALSATSPFRLSETELTECARYWHRQCVPPASRADQDDCVRYWYRQQVNARPQSVENDCRDEEGVIRAKEFSALSQRRNEAERLFKKEYADIEALSAQGYTAQAADMMRDWNNRYQLWADSLSAEIAAAADRAQRIVDQHACARGDRSNCRW